MFGKLFGKKQEAPPAAQQPEKINTERAPYGSGIITVTASYSITGIGVVLACTVKSGVLAEGCTIKGPTGDVKVKTIEVNHRREQSAPMGSKAGVHINPSMTFQNGDYEFK